MKDGGQGVRRRAGQPVIYLHQELQHAIRVLHKGHFTNDMTYDPSSYRLYSLYRIITVCTTAPEQQWEHQGIHQLYNILTRMINHQEQQQQQQHMHHPSRWSPLLPSQ